MIPTSVRHGQLVIDFDESTDVQIVRQDNGQAIRLSLSEWMYLLKVAEIHEWPIAAPNKPLEVRS